MENHLDETIASELYGKSFATRSQVVLEPTRVKFRHKPLSPESRERRARASRRNLVKAIKAQLERVLAIDCLAEAEEKAKQRAPFLPYPASMNNGQLGINFHQAMQREKRLDYVDGRPYRYALTR